MNGRIYPSLISAPPLNLKQIINDLDPHCAGFHIDIMDNHFVPNLTWGHHLTNVIDEHSSKPSWVHLMVTDPLSIIERLQIKEQSIISFHIESDVDIAQAIKIIKDKKWIPSLAISPQTPIENLFPFLPIIHHVLLMSVHPGFSGQTFLPKTINRLLKLANFKKEHNLHLTISLDGGINKDNIKECFEHGAEDFAIASSIFSQSNYIQATKELYEIIK